MKKVARRLAGALALDYAWEFHANKLHNIKKAHKTGINYILQELADVKTVFTNGALKDGNDSKSIPAKRLPK